MSYNLTGLSLRELTKAQEDALVPLGKARTTAIKQLVEQGKSFEAAQKVPSPRRSLLESMKQASGKLHLPD